jgi:hypothetical protein
VAELLLGTSLCPIPPDPSVALVGVVPPVPAVSTVPAEIVAGVFVPPGASLWCISQRTGVKKSFDILLAARSYRDCRQETCSFWVLAAHQVN